MTGQALLVAPGRPGAHATIAGALESATDGALIQLAAGTYTEVIWIGLKQRAKLPQECVRRFGDPPGLIRSLAGGLVT